MARLARIVVPVVARCRHTRRSNFREGRRGYWWQGRFGSFAVDEHYLRRAARCMELNAVRAKLCRIPGRWPWSSAPAQVANEKAMRLKP